MWRCDCPCVSIKTIMGLIIGTWGILMRHDGRMRGRYVRSMNSFQIAYEMMNPSQDLMTRYYEYLSVHSFKENIIGGFHTKGSFHDENMDKWGS